jgi:predicted ATPase
MAIRGFPPIDARSKLRRREIEAQVPSEDEGWRISARIEADHLPTDESELSVEIELWPSAGFWRPERRSRMRTPAVMLAPYSHRNQPLQLRRLSRLIEEGSKPALLDMLRTFDPRMVDIEIVTDRSTGSPTIAVRHINAALLPTSVMGDGFRRALMIALALTQARDGMLLIDEIETALHVSVLDKLFTWLTHACDAYNIQMFATTHSLEAVTAILASIPEHSHEMLAAYHLGSDDGHAVDRKTPPPKRYSADMMMRLVRDRGLDIR